MQRCFCCFLFAITFGASAIKAEQNDQVVPRTYTLSELSKLPGISVESTPIPTAAEDYDLLLANFRTEKPSKKVTIAIFPDATIFSPDFFKNFKGYADAKASGFSAHNLKVYLFIENADKTILCHTAIGYDADISDFKRDGAHHIEIEFYIADDLMEHSFLVLDEIMFRGKRWRVPIYFGAAPAKK